MLVNFLGDLGKISGDMKHLKEQSIEINQQLNNHQRVRAELSQVFLKFFSFKWKFF